MKKYIRALISAVLFIFVANNVYSQYATMDISGRFTFSKPGCNYWNLQYKPTSSSTYSQISNIYCLSQTLKLNPFISWDFQRGVQGSYSVNWEQPITFNAEYGSISKSVGYSYDFDGNDISEGWRGYQINTTNSLNYGMYETTQTHTNSAQALGWSWTSTDQFMLVSPKLTDLSTDKKCSIYMYVYNTGPYTNAAIDIGTIKDPYNPSTFHSLKRVPVTGEGLQKIEVFFNNYTSGDNYIAIKTSGDYAEMELDDFSYEQSVNCFASTNLNITNVTETSAQINFTAPPEQTKWELSLKNVTNGGTQTIPVDQNPFLLQNLAGITKYEVQLRASCDPGHYSNWTPAVSFTTPCANLSPGYYTGFDEYVNLNPCWTRIAPNITDLMPYDKNTNTGTGVEPNSGTKFMMFKVTTAKTYLVSPYISDLDNTKRIRFKLYDHKRRDFLNHSVTIGTLADPSNPGTFAPIETLDPIKINPIGIYEFGSFWQQYIVDFKNYNKDNNHHYIAFRIDGDNAAYNSNEYVYLDDFYYEQIPDCKEATNLQVLSYEHDKVTISWDSDNNNTSGWQIQYGPSGFSLGTGKIINAENSPFTINSDLLPSTAYDFYIRTVCSGGYSSWSGKGYFKTRCEGVSVGYKTGFENDNFENNTSCWRRLTPLVRNYFYRPANFIDISNTIINLKSWSSSLDYESKTILVSPRLTDFKNGNQISFSVYYTKTTYPKLQSIIVGTLSDPNDYLSFVPFKTISAPFTMDSWQKYTVDFSGYQGKDQYIGIKQVSSNGNNSISIDNIEYLENPCKRVTSVVAEQSGDDSVTLAWNSNLVEDASTTWQIEYGPYGFTPGTGTLVTADKNPYVLNGLETYKKYQARVRNICENGFANWSDLRSFRVCCAVTAPFYETFDQYDANKNNSIDYPDGIPNFCWTSDYFLTAGVRAYYLHNRNSPPNSGFVYHSYNEDKDGMLISPYLADFDTKKRIKFWVDCPYNRSSNKNLKLLVGTLKNPLDLTSFTVFQTIPMKDIPLPGKEISIDFSQYTGSDNHIAFKTTGYENQGSNEIFIDNVYYSDIPDCSEPIDIIFQNTDSNSTLIKWQKGPDSNIGVNVEIEYGLSGFFIGTGTIVTTDSNEILILGLQASSIYDFYFKTVCKDGNSIVVGPKKAETSCNVYPLPWAETFNSLEQYGLNKLPLCFKLDVGEGYITSCNVPITINTSYFKDDHVLKGFDDNFYLRLTDNFNSSMFTPQYNLKAGVTYKFGLKARKGYEYAGMGILLSVGRSREAYAMESNLPGVGTEISEYQYNDLAFYYTPMETGNYNYLMQFSASGGLKFILDDLSLDEGYKSTVNGAHLFDFNNGIDEALIIEKTETSNVILVTASGKKVLKMSGSSTSAYNDSENQWLENQNNVTKVNFKVNASDPFGKMSAPLYLRFKLKQTYGQSTQESAFRVVINGHVVGDVIYPKTSNQDEFEWHEVDLSPFFEEGDVRISLQHLGKSDASAIGDNAFLSDIEINSTTLANAEFESLNLTAYPNPAKNTIKLVGSDVISRIQVFNISGQMLLDEHVNGNDVVVDLSKYNIGVYFIKALNDERSKVLKVIKE